MPKSTTTPPKPLARPRSTARQRTAAEAWVNTLGAPFTYRLARAYELVPGYLTICGLALVAVLTLVGCVLAGVVVLA